MLIWSQWLRSSADRWRGPWGRKRGRLQQNLTQVNYHLGTALGNKTMISDQKEFLPGYKCRRNAVADQLAF